MTCQAAPTRPRDLFNDADHVAVHRYFCPVPRTIRRLVDRQQQMLVRTCPVNLKSTVLSPYSLEIKPRFEIGRYELRVIRVQRWLFEQWANNS
jgi:hypothetical protein